MATRIKEKIRNFAVVMRKKLKTSPFPLGFGSELSRTGEGQGEAVNFPKLNISQNQHDYEENAILPDGNDGCADDFGTDRERK